MCRLFTTCILLCWGLTSHTQTHIIDSLKRNIYAATTDKQRLKAVLDLCEEHRSLNRDTLDYYSSIATTLAAKVGDQKSRDLAQFAVANTFSRWGWIDSAMATIDPVLLRNPVTDPASRELYFKMARQKALYFGGKSRYTESLDVLYQLVADAEKYRDTVVIGTNMNTIGSVALMRAAPRVAIDWFGKALQYSTNDGRYKPVLAGVYANMGEAYSLIGKQDSAEFYVEKGVALFRELQNLSSLAITLQKQSNIYLRGKKLDKAEEKLKEMIAVRLQTNDAGMWVDENLALIDFYIETKQIEKAIAACQQALRRGVLTDPVVKGVFNNSPSVRLSVYKALARCYKIAGKTDLYQQTLEEIIVATDSLYEVNTAEALAEAETKYEVQKKENTIVQQKLDIARNDIRFYLSIAALLFIAVISYVLFISYRRREKLKTQLMLEKEKETALQAVALAEENERKRIAADLHDNLGAYAASIASNLEFIVPAGRNNQEEIALQELHSNSKAIVSQLDDTIWALNKDALTLTAISDRLKIFVRRLKPSYPNIDMDIEEHIVDDLALQPTQAFHLFQVIQEAVVNALKHSGAKQVKIFIESEGDSWTISITDNGNGIRADKPKATQGGNGLHNMKNRCAMAGWGISWEASFPKGTKVVIEPKSMRDDNTTN